MEITQLAFLNDYLRIRRRVYLDHNATTPVSRGVRKTMTRALRHWHENPSSAYSAGRRSAEIIDEARQQVASAIGADPDSLIFTGSATESNNAILKSLSDRFYPAKNRIISTPIEHPSVMKTLAFLESRGIHVTYCPVDRQGRVLPDELEKLIDGDTFLICCHLANNELGTIQDIRAVAGIARRKNVYLFSDCVQALGKIPVDVRALGIDYASFSAHKLHGPKGAGALYVRAGNPFAPLLHGGYQEGGMRAGTESIHDIAGFGAACRDVERLLVRSEQIRWLKIQFIAYLREVRPDCIIHSPESDCLPNTISVTFPEVANHELMALLDHRGIAVSAGSACHEKGNEPSHVLKAIGLTDQQGRETLRISLGRGTRRRDILYVLSVLNGYFSGRLHHIPVITTEELNETILDDPDTFFLDVRAPYQKRKLRSLRIAREISFTGLNRYLRDLPVDKHIVVACQNGHLSYIAAYYLKSKGFKKVSNLKGGLAVWKARRSDLYQKYALA